MTSASVTGHAPATSPSDDEQLLIQFDDLDQQHDASMLAMWAFLATEVLFFGGLIMAFVVYRTIYRDTFSQAAQQLNVILGGINTVVLLASSLTMALAVRAAQLKQRAQAVSFLIATMIFGTGFLVIKGFEYYHEYEENLIPFISFEWPPHGTTEHHDSTEMDAALGAPVSRGDWQDPEMKRSLEFTDAALARSFPGEAPPSDAQKARLFFVLYFFMTGLHAIHLIIGLVLVGIIAALVWTQWFSGFGETQIEVTGLYWHFIDIVWVFLYPLLYLIDIHQ